MSWLFYAFFCFPCQGFGGSPRQNQTEFSVEWTVFTIYISLSSFVVFSRFFTFQSVKENYLRVF